MTSEEILNRMADRSLGTNEKITWQNAYAATLRAESFVRIAAAAERLLKLAEES